MSIRSFFEETNFSFNSAFLPCLYRLDVSLKEFILLIYFVNIRSKKFDMDDITEVTKLSSSDVLSSFNMLIEKKLVYLETVKNSSGIFEEIVNLDKFYDLVNQNEKSENSTSTRDILSFLAKEISLPEDDSLKEIVDSWISSGFSFDDIKEALNEAKYNGVLSLRYVDKMLFESKNSKNDLNNTADNDKLFDYDWLDSEKK